LGALALGARIVLAVTFLLAAVAKLAHRQRVVAQMDDILGPRAAPTAAVVVPSVEIGLALALLFATQSALPAWLAAGVLLVFTAVLIWAQARRVPCPCFGGGASARPVGPAAVVRNGVLLGLAVIGSGSIDGATAPATLMWVAVLGAVTAGTVWAAR
jgi:uncharacterized membrane protein YphA (DoxX/SURF4 family)